MADDIRVTINANDIQNIQRRYDEQFLDTIYSITNTYNQKIVRDAKEIIREKGKIDTGRLRNSVKSSVTRYANKITGEIYSGTKYARFIHEGAEHEGDTLKPHFVPFSVAPSLLAWAKRKNIIKRINDNWCFVGKNNQQYRISNIDKSGLKVFSPAIKFLEIPFNTYKNNYINELKELVL